MMPGITQELERSMISISAGRSLQAASGFTSKMRSPSTNMPTSAWAAAPVPSIRNLHLTSFILRISGDVGLHGRRRPGKTRMRQAEIDHGLGAFKRGQDRVDHGNAETPRHFAVDIPGRH